MTPSEFIRKWKDVALTERSACHEHFLDLCALAGHPTPVEMDKTGEVFTFEKGVAKEGGGSGWADVWKKGFFGWEYKQRHADLNKAYAQLLRYREALENPPLLVVCDMNIVEIHTNFTGTATAVHTIPLEELDGPRSLEVLRAVFHDPEKLKPGVTSEAITAAAARHIGEIAQRLRERGDEPHAVARFLDRLVFCMFAEDIGLLQERLFTRLLDKTKGDPERFRKTVTQLFDAMATGGDFGMDTVRRFNGNLFQPGPALLLDEPALKVLVEASRLDWSAVDPSIFGTLFERGLDPAKRAQLGAHYTSRQDIEALVEPVVMAPLRRAWETARARARDLLDKSEAKSGAGRDKYTTPTIVKNRERAASAVADFLGYLGSVKVLDPAGGSGNFLYVTLQKMKDLEKEAVNWAADRGLQPPLPLVHPRQFFCIEVNPYAYELAQMTLWIGYLQWIRANGLGQASDPVLESLEGNFLNMDAIVGTSSAVEARRGGPPWPPGMDSEPPREGTVALPYGPRSGAVPTPHEPSWPKVDFIVGNPPFLGGKMLRRELGDAYVDRLFAAWDGRVPREADLCCYWFERARQQIADGTCQRAGLLATQGIRGGANRQVLNRIKRTGDIFFAESDRPWILDGANVHVSMVGFDKGDEMGRVLDGKAVSVINANLTGTADITQARRLPENVSLVFMGDTKGGAFDIEEPLALQFLRQPNPHGIPNSQVVTPWVNGKDVTARSRSMCIIDFGVGMHEGDASRFEAPFEYLREHVKPERDKNNREVYRRLWWQHVEARPGMREAIANLPRFLATVAVAKHRLFVWMEEPALPDHAVFVFARSDDYFFGVLHSRFHEVWSRAQATQLREASSGTRYTPTTCFETFPFPWPPGKEPQEDPKVRAIAGAARELNALREAWLNPPEWTKEEILEFPGSATGPWARHVAPPSVPEPPRAGTVPRPETEPASVPALPPAVRHETGQAEPPDPPSRIGLVRYPRLVPKDEACAALLKKRTLTNLYNQRPAWLDLAHKRLDAAVVAAYGWTAEDAQGQSDGQILERLLALNLARTGAQ